MKRLFLQRLMLSLLFTSVLLAGSAISIAGMFKYWQIGIYGAIISLLIAALEWPRSKRKKGSTVERRFQRPFAQFVNKLGVLGRNYFFRFLVYLLLCVPCCFTLATLLGGICMILTGAIYFIAAIKGEEWMASGQDTSDQKAVNTIQPPKKPPPRPSAQNNIEERSLEGVTMEIAEEGAGASRAGARPVRPPPRPKGASADVIHDVGT
ncbi:cytochrome b-245 light chain-like isoform X2 [Dreissena polymorpha]|uniref:cytochrome b-245 light chain-like isoform X2 n=1 Tax=Dreissena polymorpha TaxID=45954 RepID=UPI00226435B0|nr:cytochrome b-245 light chain-like isoform X2 [Dreissena polymorpha]